MSFEHYPFAPCEITWSDLYREPELTEGILKIWRADGVPPNVPLINTESNVSWGLTQPMTDIFAALWLGDSVGSFLTFGGDIYYHSPIQPEPIRSGCRGWSTYGNFVADENLNIRTHTSQYHASRDDQSGMGQARRWPSQASSPHPPNSKTARAMFCHRLSSSTSRRTVVSHGD